MLCYWSFKLLNFRLFVIISIWPKCMSFSNITVFRFSMLSDSAFVYLLSYLSQLFKTLKVWSGSFWRKIKGFRLYPTVYFIGSAIKNIWCAFKMDLIKPKIVELYLFFICIYVLHINIVRHGRYCLEVSNHKHRLCYHLYAHNMNLKSNLLSISDNFSL